MRAIRTNSMDLDCIQKSCVLRYTAFASINPQLLLLLDRSLISTVRKADGITNGDRLVGLCHRPPGMIEAHYDVRYTALTFIFSMPIHPPLVRCCCYCGALKWVPVSVFLRRLLPDRPLDNALVAHSPIVYSSSHWLSPIVV